MPRVTRAALRSNTLSEEANLAASTPLPLTPLAKRAPLGEIAGNVVEVVVTPDAPSQQSKSEKKAPSKGKRGRVKKTKKPEKIPISEENIDVLEDDNQSATSSAVNEACQELLKGSNGDIHQVVMHDYRPHTPPSPAVNATRRRSSPDAQSLLDPKMLVSDAEAVASSQAEGERGEERSLASIDPSTLAGMTPPKSIDGSGYKNPAEEQIPNNDDLNVEQIVMRSPAKPIARIEDSVEAIDAFEEAIEKVGELIPAITENHIPTVGVKKQRRVVAKSDASNLNTNASRSTIHNPASTNAIATRSRTATPRNPLQKTRAPSLRQTPAASALKSTTRQAKALKDESDAVSTNLAKVSRSSLSAVVSKPPVIATKRISSIHKAPFQTIKSTKPLTRPSFELPGDIVARKLKAQKEERLKQGEEEPSKKPVFKARPIRLSSAPSVKPTLTSKARISMARQDARDSVAFNSRAPTIRPLAPSGSISTANSAKRLSIPSAPKRDTMISSNGSKRVTSHQLSKGIKPSRNSSEISREEVTAFDVAQQKLRGKEVFNRVRVEQDERERAKKEREEAARKARAEAAERGRIASREWAEKQKLKKMGLESGNHPKNALAVA